MKHEYIAPTSSLISIEPCVLMGTSLEKGTGTIGSPDDILSNEKDFGDDSVWGD